MRITYITAGAAGMFCGSCMHDNTLVAALARTGHDALLVPTYTPIRTDEPDVSTKRVFFGGINVYLQQKWACSAIRPGSSTACSTPRPCCAGCRASPSRREAEDLGDLTVSMLKGEHGKQSKEVAKLAQWLAAEVKPQVVNLTNAILSGMVHELKRAVGAPVLCSLQGDDIFLEALPEPFRSQALELIREHCREIDGFIATSAYYADFMAEYFAIPRSASTSSIRASTCTATAARARPPTAGRSRSATSPASVRKRGCTSWPRRSGCCDSSPAPSAAGCASPAGWAKATSHTLTIFKRG